MKSQEFIKNILQDAKVELHQEFDRNFERKGFFNDKWKDPKFKTSKGSTMMRSGKLRRGFKAKIRGGNIVFTNNMPYASILNEGGTITITKKMISFFWAMYYKANSASKSKNKERQQKLSTEAQQWKALALQKVGAKMTIEKRQFIGEHAIVKQRIDAIVKYNLKQFNENLIQKLNNK